MVLGFSSLTRFCHLLGNNGFKIAIGVSMDVNGVILHADEANHDFVRDIRTKHGIVASPHREVVR